MSRRLDGRIRLGIFQMRGLRGGTVYAIMRIFKSPSHESYGTTCHIFRDRKDAKVEVNRLNKSMS